MVFDTMRSPDNQQVLVTLHYPHMLKYRHRIRSLWSLKVPLA